MKKFPLNKGGDGKAVRGLSYKTGKLNISGSHNTKRHQHFRLPSAPSHDNPHAFGAAPFFKGELPPCRRSAIFSQLPAEKYAFEALVEVTFHSNRRKVRCGGLEHPREPFSRITQQRR